MTEVVLLLLASIPLMACTELAIWAFHLRPLIRRHGGTSVTAANWGLSICADLTTAWEIRREMGGFPTSATARRWLRGLRHGDYFSTRSRDSEAAGADPAKLREFPAE